MQKMETQNSAKKLNQKKSLNKKTSSKGSTVITNKTVAKQTAVLQTTIPLEEIPDEQLIINFVKGDDISFQNLVDRYKTKVYGLALRLTKNNEDAEEVLQDVFITVYRKIDSFQGNSKFSSWLYRVTANSAFMKLRKNKQSRYISFEDVIATKDNELLANTHNPIAELEEDMNVANLRENLENAISKLPPDYRAVYILRDIDELSNKEVSEILHLGIPAIKSRLHRSRLMLQKKLFSAYNEFKGLPAGAKIVKGKKKSISEVQDAA